jgi:hypothetical protein
MDDSRKRTDVPETISDKKWAGIQARAIEAHKHEDPFSKAGADRRHASRDQHDKRHLS